MKSKHIVICYSIMIFELSHYACVTPMWHFCPIFVTAVLHFEEFILFFQNLVFAAGDSGANQTPLWLGDDLEFWPEKASAKEKVRFVKIASLSTELIAVSEKGILYQWRWSDMTPHRHDNPNGNHPRSSGLGLTNEKVVKISASNIRYISTFTQHFLHNILRDWWVG